MKWDFIVVGAGSAGCALVHELVQAGRTVLLLEAGRSDRSLRIKIPSGTWFASADHDWGYRGQPDPTRDGASEKWARGRVLGGTSSINGTIYTRGAPHDFERWARHCGHAGGWSADDVMPIFRQFEDSDQPNPVRGRGGPLRVRTVRRPHELTRAFVESARAAGFPINPDYNADRQEGVGYLQFTQRRGLRWSSADAFLKPLRSRKNLQLRLGAVVEKIELQEGKAIAVVFRHEGRVHRERAQDIVLSAGAINSPKILMLSGIGDPQALRAHGIDAVLELPAVGRNLIEQPYVALGYRSNVPSYNLTQGLLQKFSIAAKYVRHGEGPISAAYEGAAFLRLLPESTVPDVQIFFAPIGWDKVGDGYRLTPYPALKVVIIHSHATGGGSVRLASSDPLAAPLIEPRLLASQGDTDTLVRGIETVRAIMRTEPIASLIHSETDPGAAIASETALRTYVRGNCRPCCHPISTCRMGAGEDAVVGPDLRVRGTENLWIADASIMPAALSANPNALCMMIGAKLGKYLAAHRRH